MRRLGDVVRAVTSKNAGNFAVAVDIECHDEASFEELQASGALAPAYLAAALGMEVDDILAVTPFAPGLAIKIAVRRLIPSGDIGETDVFGVQQFAPFMELELPDQP